MKTATIILISIGLFVLIKNSQAANADEVFNTLATKNDKNGNPFIPYGVLEKYLNEKDWKNPEGLTAEAAEFVNLKLDENWNYIISKGKWDAMIRTATWLLRIKKPSAEVWSELGGKNTISTNNLVAYMNTNGWEKFGQGMTAEVAADHIARGGSYIIKNEWNATIEIEACIRNAQEIGFPSCTIL